MAQLKHWRQQMTNIEKQIGTIGNYYGGLTVKMEDEKYYWSSENYDGHNWQEIPKKLYQELLRFDKTLQRHKL